MENRSGVRRKKFRRVQGYGRPRRGSGGGAPRTPENFRKFAKKFLKKIEKMHYLGRIFNKFNKPCVNFRALGRKTQSVGKF